MEQNPVWWHPTENKKLKWEINKLEVEGDDRQLTAEEIKLRRQLQEDLWVAAHWNASILRQKARTTWIKEGDYNSWFFHMTVNWKRRSNTIKGVVCLLMVAG